MPYESGREELVSVLRGIAAAPVIYALQKSGAIPTLLRAKGFEIADLAMIQNERVRNAVLDYMESLGLIDRISNVRYRITENGHYVLARAGALEIVISYNEYFSNLAEIFTSAEVLPHVSRSKNIEGSGSAHATKFFPFALDFINKRIYDCYVDIGCGDGTFLEMATAAKSENSIVAVDLAQVAVDATKHRLLGKNVVGVVTDARNIDTWSKAILPSKAPAIISLWFVIHEISGNNLDYLETYFKHMHSVCPTADILIGEITRVDPSDLKEIRSSSVVPDFLFFHALSGQGVMRWCEYQTLLMKIPYALIEEHRFDEIETVDGKTVPSSFIWLLRPKPTS